jgi:transcription initiation factor IIF auxiliary subunit
VSSSKASSAETLFAAHKLVQQVDTQIELTVKVVTQQQIIGDVPPAEEGFPMRKWSIEIVAVNQQGKEVPPIFIGEVTYHLHPSFYVEPDRRISASAPADRL